MALNTSELLAATLQAQDETLADEVMASNAGFTRMKKSAKTKSGGHEIRIPIVYSGGASAQWFSYYDSINYSSGEVATVFKVPWCLICQPVSFSLHEELMNAGEEQLFDELETRVDAAKSSIINTANIGLHNDGTTSKAVYGLGYHCATTPTSGTYQDIDRASYSWAQNKTLSWATDVGATLSSANVGSGLLKAWMATKRGADAIDLILAGKTLYEAYHTSLTAIQRLTNLSNDLATSGFKSLDFMGADMVLDESWGDAAYTSGVYGYALQTKYITIYKHSKLFFEKIGENKTPLNQFATVQWIGAMWNIGASGPNFQTVLKT